MQLDAPGNAIPFRHNRRLQAMIVWLVAVWVITAIHPQSRQDWFLENLLVLLYGGLLAFTYRRFAFSNLSYGLFTVFLTLHLIGAHYTYALTPIGDWLKVLFRVSRNPYDRIVHFSFGLLIAYPFREVLMRAAGVKRAWSYLLAVIVVAGFGGLYEVLEGMVAQIVAPGLGSQWLGTQGDPWDAQKDMALAFIGAVIAMVVTWWWARRRR